MILVLLIQIIQYCKYTILVLYFIIMIQVKINTMIILIDLFEEKVMKDIIVNET